MNQPSTDNQSKRLELSKVYECLSYLSMASFSLRQARSMASELPKHEVNLDEHLEFTQEALKDVNDLLIDRRDELTKSLPILAKNTIIEPRNLVDDPRGVRFN